MKNLDKYSVLELDTNEVSKINGGGLTTGIGSLFRSSLAIGARALDAGLTTLGFLAGLGDGIRNGANN